MTGSAGSSSQGVSAIAWTFCASCSSTPQLMAGGRRPRPRKLSDVSLMIIAGSASVVAAMMWLEERRHHVAEDDAQLAAAGRAARP